MSLTLHAICEELRREYGHVELWLDWRAWPFSQKNPPLEEQPVVISCSGRPLAAWDGTGESWSFIPQTEDRRFNEKDDDFNLARNKDNFLDNRRIAVLEDKYRF